MGGAVGGTRAEQGPELDEAIRLEGLALSSWRESIAGGGELLIDA
jgi:hypothetical protein